MGHGGRDFPDRGEAFGFEELVLGASQLFVDLLEIGRPALQFPVLVRDRPGGAPDEGILGEEEKGATGKGDDPDDDPAMADRGLEEDGKFVELEDGKDLVRVGIHNRDVDGREFLELAQLEGVLWRGADLFEGNDDGSIEGLPDLRVVLEVQSDDPGLVGPDDRPARIVDLDARRLRKVQKTLGDLLELMLMPGARQVPELREREVRADDLLDVMRRHDLLPLQHAPGQVGGRDPAEEERREADRDDADGDKLVDEIHRVTFREGRSPDTFFLNGSSSFNSIRGTIILDQSKSLEEGTGMPEMHVIDYKIFGSEMQFVEIELDPGEATVAEAGGMMYMEDGVEMETVFGDGSQQKSGAMSALMGAGKRLLTGESLFMTIFVNQGQGKKKVAFASPYPGKIIPLDLKELGGQIICQKDAFLCAAKGVSVGIAFQKKLGVGLFGGEGFIMQKLEGDGYAFVHAGGTLTKRDLAPGEMIRVDTGCIVALQPSVSYDIEYVGKVKSALFGGEGLFFATLRGPGRIWLQSLPFSRLANRIYSATSRMGGGKGEGGLLGTLLGGHE